MSSGALLDSGTYGLPSGPSTMPFVSFFGPAVSVSCCWDASIVPGAIIPAQNATVVAVLYCALSNG